MKEILQACPDCWTKTREHQELMYQAWSITDIGVLVCPKCGWTVEYNLAQKEKQND